MTLSYDERIARIDEVTREVRKAFKIDYPDVYDIYQEAISESQRFKKGCGNFEDLLHDCIVSWDCWKYGVSTATKILSNYIFCLVCIYYFVDEFFTTDFKLLVHTDTSHPVYFEYKSLDKPGNNKYAANRGEAYIEIENTISCSDQHDRSEHICFRFRPDFEKIKHDILNGQARSDDFLNLPIEVAVQYNVIADWDKVVNSTKLTSYFAHSINGIEYDYINDYTLNDIKLNDGSRNIIKRLVANLNDNKFNGALGPITN